MPQCHLSVQARAFWSDVHAGVHAHADHVSFSFLANCINAMCACFSLFHVHLSQEADIACDCRMYKSQESGLFEYATAKIMKLMLSRELNKRLKVRPALVMPATNFPSLCLLSLSHHLIGLSRLPLSCTTAPAQYITWCHNGGHAAPSCPPSIHPFSFRQVMRAICSMPL